MRRHKSEGTRDTRGVHASGWPDGLVGFRGTFETDIQTANPRRSSRVYTVREHVVVEGTCPLVDWRDGPSVTAMTPVFGGTDPQ